MPKKVFYSFHFDEDNWRVSQIRGIGSIEDNKPATDHDWEAVKRGGAPAIQRWIDGQMSGKTCAIVLIGAATAGRKWIDYEISKAWSDRKGVLGIHIHQLLNSRGLPSSKGRNPLEDHFTKEGHRLSGVTLTKIPDGLNSKAVYNHIAANLELWIDAAIAIRARYS